MPILKDGNVYKYSIDYSGLTDDWDEIGRLINLYFKINPQELKDLKHDVALIRLTRKDRATSKDKTFKWGMTMPSGLMVEMERAFPNLLDKPGSIQRFIKKFPIFGIPEN